MIGLLDGVSILGRSVYYTDTCTFAPGIGDFGIVDGSLWKDAGVYGLCPRLQP